MSKEMFIARAKQGEWDAGEVRVVRMGVVR